MAAAIGAQVETYGLPYDQTLSDWGVIEQKIAEFKPKMITAVHCETPSGTLNPMEQVGQLKARYGVPLLYVDAVASAGGTPVLTDEWNIDLCLGGSQKALSAPPLAAFLSVSPAAWKIIEQVDYQGYDALKPFRIAQRDFYFPYTPDWHGLAALYKGSQLLLEEGLPVVYQRHQAAAQRCRAGLLELGLKLFPAAGAIPSPTVTAVYVPDGIAWQDLDARFREKGLVVGGSYGPLTGKIFRLGHMGTQADVGLVEQALAVIERVVQEIS